LVEEDILLLSLEELFFNFFIECLFVLLESNHCCFVLLQCKVAIFLVYF